MSSYIKKIMVGLKREYWEYRKLALGLPIIISVLIVLASAMATLSHQSGAGNLGSSQNQSEKAPLVSSSCWSEVADEKTNLEFNPKEYLDEVKAETASRFISVFIGVAWLVGLFYLLSSLYQDRRDNSILYWKSLPVSETQNVLLKLFFGVIGLGAISILIAWVTYLFLWLLGLGLVACVNGGGDWFYIDRVFDAKRLLLDPWLILICGLLWGAPVFSYVLLVSSMARRLPFFLLLLPPFVFAVLERIIFGSKFVSQFIFDHMPFAVAHSVMHGATAGEVWQEFMVGNAPSLLLGIAVAAVFLSIAVYYRNHRFDG